MAYAFHYLPPRIAGADENPLVRGLWEWLRTEATPEKLSRLESLRAKEKVDARVWGVQQGLSEPEVTLLRLQTSGAYVGQLSSWVLYPQHSPNLGPLREALPLINRLAPMADDFRKVAGLCDDRGAFAFVDPPYLNTSGNYKSQKKDHGGLVPKEVEDFVLGLKCPVLVTYGDGAHETFPRLKWTKAMERKVPILRGGGTRLRTEWFSRLNW